MNKNNNIIKEKKMKEEETYNFNADIQQLMCIIINTFYSNKEIFLRELISNASDALDKIRYKSLTNIEKNKSELELKIKIKGNKKESTLIIEDTGIGMTKEELISNLGTIAKSGTKSFMELIKETGDISMIGQFGVGFYSAYLVSEKIYVISKNNEDEQYIWESEASGTFKVRKDNEYEYGKLKRGTKIICFLKKDQLEYLEEDRIKELIKKHSEYIGHPIELYVEKEERKGTAEESEEERKGTAEESEEERKDKEGELTSKSVESNEIKIEEIKEEKEKRKHQKTIIKSDWEVINKNKPLWMRKEDEITKTEYNEFYKIISKNNNEENMKKIHFKTEGQIEFTGLLYIPERAPYDMYEFKRNSNNIKLYVRRVFIMEDCKEIIPEWLNFIKGIIDSEDLPLNISRESLQQNNILKIIKKKIIKKCIEMFNELAENEEDYKKFYEQFGKNIKIGMTEDEGNKEKLIELLRFNSSKEEEKLISLREYVDRMKEDQKDIYYISGDNIETLSKSPFVENIKKKDYEILYMTDPLDEYCINTSNDYDNKKLKCCTKENLEINNEEENEKLEESKIKLEELCKTIKEILGENIEKCIVSNRIVKSPCVLVTSEHGWSANMERIMKCQAMHEKSMSQYMKGRKTMEINPENEIIKLMMKKIKNDNKDVIVKDLIWLLYDTSLLTSGFELDNSSDYAERIHNMIKIGLSIDYDSNENEEKEIKNKEENISSGECQGEEKQIEEERTWLDSNNMENVD